MSSSGFLQSILESMDFVSLPILTCSDDVQDNYPTEKKSQLLLLDDKLLKEIASYIPLKERFNSLGRTCRKMYEIVEETSDSVAFYKDGIDGVSSLSLLAMLNKRGPNVKYLNFDLFRSSGLAECSQWSWRQQVVRSIRLCPNLTQLDVLVCTRHRLRDADLMAVFKNCHHLDTLKIDAQFISGHCFEKSPRNLRHVELEMCYRIIPANFIVMCSKMRKLKVLHVSEFKALTADLISIMVNSMKKLEDLSIVSDNKPESACVGYNAIGRLRHLKTLCLEGIPTVSDRVLADLCNPVKSPCVNSIENLSLAFCRNISSAGIESLCGMKRLKCLNLDGINNRDISFGVEKVAELGNLEKVLLAEDTCVHADSVVRLLQTSPRLKLLDVSNNNILLRDPLPQRMIGARRNWLGAELTVLTNNDDIWLGHHAPRNNKGEVTLKVVHLHRHLLQLPSGGIISDDGPLQLPHGVLATNLRRGNRYRLLIDAIVPPEMASDPVKESENDEYLNAMYNGSFGSGDKSGYQIPLQETNPNWVYDLSRALPNFEPDVKQIPTWHPEPPFAPPDTNVFSDFFTQQLLAPPVMNDPLLFCPYGNNDIGALLNALTTGSGGAPRPPTEDPKLPEVLAKQKYRRLPRQNRKSLQKPSGPLFSESDFPPLC